MMHFRRELIPEPVLRLSEVLGPQKSYAVGGIVRDSIRATLASGNQTIQKALGNDWDLATPLRPKEVLQRLRQRGITAVPIGIEHGTIAAIIDRKQYEITTFRYDIEYTDGRHPIVGFADTIEEDLKRRDFTINAFALDIESGDVIDNFGGLEDLIHKRIRTVGEPDERFEEDHLRMLRATRFAALLEGEIETKTFMAIRKRAAKILKISTERVRDEIVKMLSYPKPSHGFILMHQTGLLLYVLPELDQGFDVWQNRFHSDDVARHTLLAVDALCPDYPFYRFCTLMHDLGKVPCKQYLPHKGDYVFYGHQYASQRMARMIMRRLRFSNKEIEQAVSIVENHMYNLKPDLSESATRRFIRKLGRENVKGFLRMRLADRKGNLFNDEGYEKGVFHFMRSLRKIDRADDALKVSDLNINGHDLMQMGLKPGPIFSDILDQLLDEVLDDPALNDRDWLLARAGHLADEYRHTGKITRIHRVEETEDFAETEPDDHQ